MKDAAFQELLKSVRQAGKIRRGTLQPSRTATFDPADGDTRNSCFAGKLCLTHQLGLAYFTYLIFHDCVQFDQGSYNYTKLSAIISKLNTMSSNYMP